MAVPHQSMRNKCEGCNKFLLLHNKIITCESCHKIVHSECAKYWYVFNYMSNSWHFSDCTDTEIKRYNPFSDIISAKFDPVKISESEDIAEISTILENWESFDPSNFQNILNRNPDLINMPSALFKGDISRYI